jgi:hypothetical protein
MKIGSVRDCHQGSPGTGDHAVTDHELRLSRHSRGITNHSLLKADGDGLGDPFLLHGDAVKGVR